MTAYCSVAEADVFLALDFDNWPVLSTEEKTSALDWGRVYIDNRFSCLDDDGEAYDDTTAPEALKHANAIAANLHSQGGLFAQEKEVSEVSVKAGSVESTKKFAVPTVASTDVPEVAQIDALLSSLCSKVKAGSVALTRV